MFSSKIICCGIMSLVVLWHQAEAACRADEHGNSECHTQAVCTGIPPRQICKLGAAPEIRPGGNCVSGQFNCGRFCIPINLHCDGQRDCSNGADETSFCPTFD
ncbi:unnamed protein product, partial [Meganyctiphanes norvegica]